MNKTLKMVLAAAGALVLGGLGEGLGAELLKKATKTDDNTEDTSTEDTSTEDTATAEESNDDIVFEEITTETTED